MKLKLFITDAVKKKSIQQAFFVYAGSLINGVSLFALNIILARNLDKTLFGIFSLSILVLNTIAEVSDFGLSAGLLRFAPYYIATNQENKLKQLVKTIWRWRVSLTIFLTVGLAACAYPLAVYIFNQKVLAPYLFFTAFGIGGVILLGFLAAYLQASQRFYYNTTVQSLKGFLRLVIITVLFLAHIQNLFVYLSVYIAIPWILFLANFRVLPKNFRKHTVDEETKNKLHQQLIKFSLWLTVSSLMGIVASRIDQIMISHYLGLGEVAIFSVAFQLIQLFPLVYNSINSVLMPKVSSIENKADLTKFLKKTFGWVSGVTLLIGVCIYPSKYLILLFFGSKYAAAMPIYVILAYGLLLNIISIPFSLTITTFKRTYLVAISALLQLIINVIGNIIFIPRYGIMGAAYTFTLSVFVLVNWNIIASVMLIKRSELHIE